MIAWLNSALMAAIVIILIEARYNIGIKVAVIERDLEWIRATLTKWGMIAPSKD